MLSKRILVLMFVVAFLFAGCLPSPNVEPVITTTTLPDATFGTAYTATVVATDADGDTLTFSLVSGPTGMVISTAGLISGWTPTVAGTQAVTVAVTDGTDSVSAPFTITVSAAEPEPEPELTFVVIEVDPKTMALFAGESEAIESVTATYEIRAYDVDIDLADCLFLSSDKDVATVNDDGLVTAVKVGTADILVSYTDDGEITKFDNLAVTVSAVELDNIVVNPKTMDLVGIADTDTIDLVTAYYNNGDSEDIDLADCDYESIFTDVATVEEDGGTVTVTAVGNGWTTIIVSYEEDEIIKTDTIKVTVSGF